MNQSEIDSSSDENSVPAKRTRVDTYGASSTTSHGSGLQEESYENSSESEVENHTTDTDISVKDNTNSIEYNPEINTKLIKVNESNSSFGYQYDDGRPGFLDNNGETDVRHSFQSSMENSLFGKSVDNGQDLSQVESGYSEKSKHMMSKMGYKPGKGLGKFEHGRVEPVEASAQKGRRGLGLQSSAVADIPRGFKWTPDASVPQAKEEVMWMPPPPDETLTGDILEAWLLKGPKKLLVEDETNFVDSNVLSGVLKSKTIFDNLDDKDMRHARFRSNPYETIGAVIFLNRAAVKMANIDAVFDFMFTNPKTPNGEVAVDNREILYFADVCAGPGGFSEYILYRKGWKAKGFGFTLKNSNDFKLNDFYAAPPETFNAYYGVKEDGNIYEPANLKSLKEHVLNQTDDKGVHFLMADGGFSVEGQENLQEILSKQLYLCQCLAALMLVRTGGHFVVKLFDVFTPFSVGLIYIMYRCFDKVCIFKPVTSRPANSERYLVCKWKKAGTESTEQHLFSVNSLLWNGLDPEEDVTQLVPLNILQEDQSFYEYVYKSNSVLGEKQIKSLLKIAAFSKDKFLKEDTQTTMRDECLKLWQLPDQVRTQPERRNPESTFNNILSIMKKSAPDINNSHSFKSTVLNKHPAYLDKVPDLEVFRNVFDWHLTFLSSGKGSPDLRIFVGCGGKQVFQLEGNIWKNVVDLQIVMPANTLIYGEIVKEYRGEGSNQLYSKSLHMIDAWMLGGIDISNLSLTERIHECGLFCTALGKPVGSPILPLRCKRFFNMELFSSAVGNLVYRAMKRVKKAVTVDVPKRNNESDMFFTVGSILFIKELKDPWVAQISKKSGYKYYFCVDANNKPRSEYYIPVEAQLNMTSAYSSRVMWSWDSPSSVLDAHPYDGVTRVDMDEYIGHNIKR